MRLIPFLIALLVAAFLYMFVVERDRLLAFARGAPTTEQLDVQEAQDATETEQDDAKQGASAPTSGENDLIRVVAIQSTARTIGSTVVLRGETEADRQVEVRAETSGLVVSEPLPRGAHVKAGEELCRLDVGTRMAVLAEARARLSEAQARVPSTEAAMIEAEARLEEARINDNAARKLSEGGFASSTRVASAAAAVRAAEAAVQSATSGFESTQAGIESATALVAAAEREIKKLSIVAPFDGLLESKTAELGSLMQQGSLCGTVIRLDPMRIVGFVPEIEIMQVEEGALAGARLTTGHDVSGQVTFVSRSADPQTRTFRVEITVPNSDLAIRDGQTAEILISADGAPAHFLPQSSLTLNDEGTLGVRLVDDSNTVSFNPVELLRDGQDGIWVGGLPDKANVIIVGQEFVVAGVKVNPSFQERNP
ncbi:efflux RND transporter periplasmic adaptor subunit [Shimia marina]|uniref:Toluene efflux pump periplasmic linker protein TtgD n=1 Tax=Shimia marina TaxID=321267 RepID=A0A0N7LSJ5_9RHOB|nr:efflux RND transporter periplasmic adaptor subunit [Shimia marina]CUH53796.1 Toluene efflux pump periplasmic linker protein TtgD precursor [Shimia marina]SFE77260.1 membrane fusion protein, multidrug efflux system [Shimia marina]